MSGTPPLLPPSHRDCDHANPAPTALAVDISNYRTDTCLRSKPSTIGTLRFGEPSVIYNLALMTRFETISEDYYVHVEVPSTAPASIDDIKILFGDDGGIVQCPMRGTSYPPVAAIAILHQEEFYQWQYGPTNTGGKGGVSVGFAGSRCQDDAAKCQVDSYIPVFRSADGHLLPTLNLSLSSLFIHRPSIKQSLDRYS